MDNIAQRLKAYIEAHPESCRILCTILNVQLLNGKRHN